MQEQTAMSLEQVLGALRRRLPLIALCVIVVAGLAFAVSKHEAKKYTASASLTFGDNTLSQQIAGLPSVNSSDLAAQQNSNVELVKTGDMAARTASILGQGLTSEKVAASLAISEVGESGAVTVSATTHTPALAAEIANTYARQFVTEQQSANRRYFRSALVLVHKQLAALSRQQRIGSDGLQLQNRAQTLTLLSELNYNGVTLAQEALVPKSPSSPRTSRNVAIGLLVGLILGVGFALLLERLDRRIRSPLDLEAVYRRPVLGFVPKRAALSRSARRADREGAASLPTGEAEAFNLIRAQLRFLDVGRDVRTVAIMSAASQEGKTLVARYLAEAAARHGQRVLLLEADFRHPTLEQQLGLESGPGLSDVLADAIPLREATRSVRLGDANGRGGGEQRLDVIPAGAVVPPEPSELLDSRAMTSLLEQTKLSHDLVVLDTPPLTVFSDALPLLPTVDGVVIVARIGHGRRDDAEQLGDILTRSGARLLGVIANGFNSKKPGVYVKPRPSASAPAHGSPPPPEVASASSSEEILI